MVYWNSVILSFSKAKARPVCLKLGEEKGPGEKGVFRTGLSSSNATAKVDESGFMLLHYWL